MPHKAAAEGEARPRVSSPSLPPTAANPAVLSFQEEKIGMNVTIPKSLEGLVREKVEEGHYSNEDEVIADALRLMQARDDVAKIKRARLKDAIERGYDDVSAGRTIALETEDQIDAFFAEL